MCGWRVEIDVNRGDCDIYRTFPGSQASFEAARTQECLFKLRAANRIESHYAASR